jgi:hypothetical protein
MQERVKIFTFVSGHGETLLESPCEEHINQWLAGIKGHLVQITQSESLRVGAGHHVTVCVWYLPKEHPPAAGPRGVERKTGSPSD